ncbi:hypothetical protein KFK09_026626 [Dendrobium nobile]|uniref:Uncharacterized protein n=1 Tax=Dendrobium nobile TaxID=94219 RepID=A0A8T3ADF3_DENNO|nr:hypothetical protein KFK09_026626 [Dendrobium nobile]
MKITNKRDVGIVVLDTLRRSQVHPIISTMPFAVPTPNEALDIFLRLLPATRYKKKNLYLLMGYKFPTLNPK